VDAWLAAMVARVAPAIVTVVLTTALPVLVATWMALATTKVSLATARVLEQSLE